MVEGHAFKVELDYAIFRLKELLRLGAAANLDARSPPPSGAFAWFAFDDPLPALMMGLRFGMQLAVRRIRGTLPTRAAVHG